MNDYKDWYTKTITLKTFAEGEMLHGVYIKGKEILKDIKCDVQPISNEQIYSDYGYVLDCSYKAFCDVDTDLKAGATVIYNNNDYSIEKIVDWDDYYILYLKAVQ